MQKARWTNAVAAAALLALPVAASAQSSTQSTPQQNPPAQSQQPPSTPQQPPATTSQQPASATQQPPAAASASASEQVDQNAAKAHLSEARDSLSQLTSLPEAAKLQGAARTQVSQLIADFNALITTQSDWRSAYAKVDSDITALLGPDAADTNAGAAGNSASGSTAANAGATGTSGSTGAAGTSGAVGTSGSTSAAGNASASGAVQIDPAIRAKLVDFRTHLKAFESSAGGAETPSASTATSPAPSGDTAASGSAAAAGGAMPPSAPTPTTSSPANPGNPSASNPNPSNPTATGTSGVSPSSPTASMDPSDRDRASSAVNATASADAQKELDAISAIIAKSKTGTLTKAQTAQLKKHVENLRALISKQ